MIDWNERLKVGDPTMDRDHRTLVDLANEFAIELGSGCSIKRLNALLMGIEREAQSHFAHEEHLMRLHRYPDAAPHAAAHAALGEALGRFASQLLAAADPYSAEVPAFLEEWVIDHIVTEDKPLADFLAHCRHDHGR